MIEVEKDIYERFCEGPQHQRLLQYRGSQLFNENTLTAIRLEWAPNGQLDRFLRINHHNVDSNSRIRWISQLAGVLQYVHSKNIVHGDVSCHNILLDENLDIKLIDFAGSSIDKSPLLISCSFRAQPPWRGTPQKAETFAFGSACYHIFTGRPTASAPPLMTKR